MIEGFRLGVFSRGTTLWDGLDFAFGDAAAWFVAGPPSSGKTLLLSILRGERRPDAGDVLVSGESLYRGNAALARAWRASCGHVPEQTIADARLTVGDLFRRSALAGGGVRESERKDRTDRLLEMVGLPGALGWRIAELSISERVRACLAAELLRGPKVLFCDGVVAGAGIPCREMLWGLFRALAREGNTVVLAERTIPERWALAAGDAEPVGPFRVYRLPVPGGERRRKENPVERTAFPLVDRLASFPGLPSSGRRSGGSSFSASSASRSFPCSCREGRAVSLPTGTPSPRCCARRSLPPRRRDWRERSPPFPPCAPRRTGTRRRRGRSSCGRTRVWIRCAAPAGTRCRGTSRSGSVPTG